MMDICVVKSCHFSESPNRLFIYLRIQTFTVARTFHTHFLRNSFYIESGIQFTVLVINHVSKGNLPNL